MAKLLQKAFTFTTAAGLTEHFKTTKGFNRLFEKVKIVSSENGKIAAEFKVGEEHLNPLGTLHGGFSSALLDTLSTSLIFSHERAANSTINMNLSFLNSGKIGDELLANVAIARSGKNVVFVDVGIKNKNTGDVLIKGILTHAKLMSKL